MMKLTVTEAAIVDLEKQREAHMARAKNLDPGGQRSRDYVKDPVLVMEPDRLDYLTKPVRIEIDFKDPIATRRQIEVAMGYLTQALVVTQDHARGVNRQRLDCHDILRNAARDIALLQGKRPAR